MAEKASEGLRKVEDGVVGGFGKIVDGFVDKFLAREGETVGEARARLAQEQKAREEAGRAEMEKRAEMQRQQLEKAQALGRVQIGQPEIPHK